MNFARVFLGAAGNRELRFANGATRGLTRVLFIDHQPPAAPGANQFNRHATIDPALYLLRFRNDV
jgi:hypothetical protein